MLLVILKTETSTYSDKYFIF